MPDISSALLNDPALYKALIAASTDGFVIIDETQRIILMNSESLRMFGYIESEVLNQNLEMLLPKRFRGEHPDFINLFGSGMHPSTRTMGSLGAVYALHKDGTEIPVEASISKMVVQGQSLFAAILRDISVRMDYEKKILGLTRLHAVQSGVNNSILRIRELTDLYKEVCRIVFELGKFPVVWIGLFGSNETEISTSTSLGLKDETLPLRLLNESYGDGHTLLTNLVSNFLPIIVEDLEDQSFSPSESGIDAVSIGLNSLMAMPLLAEGTLRGIFLVFASQKSYFSEEEASLLNEVAGDISFAILYSETHSQVRFLSNYDPLTGLANRAVFLDRLEQYIGNHGQLDSKIALLIMNIDRFKSVNDTFGRKAGDELLIQIAERFERSSDDKQLRHARLGGDVFAIVVPEMQDANDVAQRIEAKLHRYFSSPFKVNDAELMISAKFGVAMYPDDGNNAEILLHNAEAALKKTRIQKSQYLFYTEHMNDQVAAQLKMENKLRGAIAREEFVIYYQPKVMIDSRKIIGAEALIRWKDPETGLIPPGEFIPVLEETGLMLELCEWILHRAMLDCNEWDKKGYRLPLLSINISDRQLRQPDFIEAIAEAISNNLSSTNIELEITEGMLMENIESNIIKLNAVKEMGVRISLDDFGTGYSSLAYLAKLPIDTLKIDRSFISSMLEDSNSMALVSTIITLCQTLQLHVIAEGVELEEQAKILRLLRCHQMQGYLFSKPIPFEDFTELMAS
jgi:diguanylate cyclase (GGDEF)-like protein/PAS domain S-box-containing protein